MRDHTSKLEHCSARTRSNISHGHRRPCYALIVHNSLVYLGYLHLVRFPAAILAMIKSLAITAGLLALAHNTAAQQTFSADAAVATDNSGESGNAPNARNRAAGEVNGGDTAELERQELRPVSTLPRTCDCLTATTVV